MLTVNRFFRSFSLVRFHIVFVWLFVTCMAGLQAQQAGPVEVDALRRSFASPPASARPWVFWFWSNSNVTKKGITADLEAMKRVGIGGVLIMDVNQGTPASSISFMDKNWQEMFRFAVQEAGRLGMEVNMNDDAGWNGSGGPWVKPEFAMQNLVHTETVVSGGGMVKETLPQPPANGGYYRDVAVVAIPVNEAPDVKMRDASPSLTVSTDQGQESRAVPDGQTPLKLSIRDMQKLPSLTLQFDAPYEACVLDLDVPGLPGNANAELQRSDDGKDYIPVSRFLVREGKNSVVFNMVRAKFYRIRFLDMNLYVSPEEIQVSNLEVHPRFHIDNLELKLWNTYYEYGKKFNPIYLHNFQSAPVDQQAPPAAIIPSEKVMELTAFMDKDGRLSWKAPPGRWTVIRYGHTWNGAVNGPAAIGGEGPECDKLSKDGIRHFFEDGLMKQLLKVTGPAARKTFTTFHIDSWEVNGQNWTKNMREEFKKRRGYDLVSFLPAFNGKVIGDLQQTERFMWDMRRTISELMVENYIAEMQKICHENGMRFSMECYTTPANDMNASNYVDEPICETWTTPGFHFTMKQMASAAHVNNRNIVGSEMFTSGWGEKWLLHPGSIKALGDSGFCGGINRFIVHRYAAQPRMNQKPGISMGPWGLHYERTQTWWEQTLPWHTYIARCQYMLRQGSTISDVLSLQPEEPGNWFEEVKIKGYDYNAIGNDAFKKVTVKNNKLIDGAGNTYTLLVLSHLGTMTEPLLRHVRDLVLQGAAVLGEPPVATPGLTGFPGSDEKLKALVAELWGDDNAGPAGRKVGKGRVFRNIPVEEALSRLNVQPDFHATGIINYTHRKAGQNDIYFIANPADSAMGVTCTFRVDGKRPQWWNPETGETKAIRAYASGKGLTRIPLVMGPAGSGFVIFTPAKGMDSSRVVTITLDGETLVSDGTVSPALDDMSKGSMINYGSTEAAFPGTYIFTKAGKGQSSLKVADAGSPITVDGSWRLRFPAGEGLPEEITLDKLISWTEIDNKETNYFSGTATYIKTLEVPHAAAKEERYFLDLGNVQVIATVFVNGKKAGILWRQPYRIDVTSLVHQGENELKIEVVNLWVNRQIGDEFLPEDSRRTDYERYKGLPYENGVLESWPEWVLQDKKSPTGRHTFTTWRLWNKNDTLQPSGLLGPVTLSQIKPVN